MIYLQKSLKGSKSKSKYRVSCGSVDSHKEGEFDVVCVPQGSRLERQLKLVHGFVERKESASYNAVADVRKSKTRAQKNIVQSAKKVTRVRKTAKKAKKES